MKPAVTADFQRGPDQFNVPKNPPPSVERLQRSPLLRRINMIRTIIRSSRNLRGQPAGHGPPLADRRWIISHVGPETVVTVNDADLARHILQANVDNYIKGRFYEIVFSLFLGRSSLTMNGP